jgi:hypothetical protein
MANLLQVKRGLEPNRLAYTPLSGEFLFTTDKKQLFIGDGTTPGGINILSSVTTMLGTAATYDVGTAPGQVVLVGSNGKIDSSLIPALGITDVFFAANEAEMLALAAAETGDVCIRTDLSQTFILSGSDSSTLTDWTMLLTPTDAVLSVNGKVGVVVLNKADVGLSNVDNLSRLEILDNATLTGTATTPTAAANSNDMTIANTAWVTSAFDLFETDIKQWVEDNFIGWGDNIDAGTF